MNIFSWSLEFIAGSFYWVYYILSYVFAITFKEQFWTFVFPINMLLHGIVISSSYLLKSDSVKETVISYGWSAPITEPLQSIFEFLRFNVSSCCNTTVSPVEEIDLLEIPNVNLFRVVAPLHMPTISGKIEEDLEIEDI